MTQENRNQETQNQENSTASESPAEPTIAIHDLAIATIDQLNEFPHSPERAAHKFKMIEIAEKSAAGIAIDNTEYAEATQRIIAAAEWCERQAAA